MANLEFEDRKACYSSSVVADCKLTSEARWTYLDALECQDGEAMAAFSPLLNEVADLHCRNQTDQ